MPLRVEAERDPMLARIAALVRERGVDPDRAVIADYFPDDTSFKFGILVTGEKKVFQFGYDFLHKPELEGTLTEWEDLTGSWQVSPYRVQVEAALAFRDPAA
jgi:hypothetical protein